MTRSILPDGEHVRRAIRWISERRREGCGLSGVELVEEASVRFDLSPLEEEWLLCTLGGIPARTAAAG
jgi:hypothetical protein